MEPAIDRFSVGRVAERIAANELEYRGFRVSDLNRDGLSANADLIAAKSEAVRQIQVKGATNAPKDKRWWIQYGYCTDEIIKGSQPVFNRKQSFYRADIVILVAVRSPSEYTCIVLPEAEAERAAQINLDRGYRTLTREGGEKKPGKIWVELDPSDRPSRRSLQDQRSLEKEREILKQYRNYWNWL